MKRALTLLALLLLTARLVIGQITIEVDINPSYGEGPQDAFEIVAYANVTNNGANTSTFTWVRDESNLVDGWDSWVCDKTTCYFKTINTESFELTPGESSILDFHVGPNDICGEGYGILTLTDDNDATNFIEVRYDIKALTLDGSTCEVTSSVFDFELDYVNIYPNPTVDFFTLTETPAELEIIHVYNTLGSKEKTFNAAQGNTYDISDLSEGVYLVKLSNSQGDNLNTIKLHKN